MGSSTDMLVFFFSFFFFEVTHSLLQPLRRAFAAYYKALIATCRRSTTEQSIAQRETSAIKPSHKNENFQTAGNIKYYLGFSMSTFHVARRSSSTHNTHETLSGGQAQSHHNLTFAAYNFVLIFIPTRTHTPQSEYASLTKGLVVGFSGICPLFSSWDKTRRVGIGSGACNRGCKTSCRLFFFSVFFLFFPFHSFYHNIDNTKLHSGIPLPSKRLAASGRRERERSCRRRRWQTVPLISSNEILVFFPLYPHRQDSPGSSAHHIPAVYCKPNGKIYRYWYFTDIHNSSFATCCALPGSVSRLIDAVADIHVCMSRRL